MLDADLARLYRVSTKQLNQQVRRNAERFPADFMLRLTAGETESLRSQFVTSNVGRGGRRYLPWAFTEHGAVMLASVLNSRVAVEASIQVVRAFVQLRRVITTHADLAGRLDKMEGLVFDAIRLLIQPPEPPPRKQVGFRLRSPT